MQDGNDPDAYSESEPNSSDDNSSDSDAEITGQDIEVFEHAADARPADVPAARSPSPGSRPIFPPDAPQICPEEGRQHFEEGHLRLGIGNQQPLLVINTLHYLCGSFHIYIYINNVNHPWVGPFDFSKDPVKVNNMQFVMQLWRTSRPNCKKFKRVWPS